jgi:hypothetical protein
VLRSFLGVGAAPPRQPVGHRIHALA